MERESMRMSRRQFTKEFKEAAVRRLELGVSLAEVARACEVNPNVLHRWKRELHEHGVKAFAGNGKARAEGAAAELELNVRSGRWPDLDRYLDEFCALAPNLSDPPDGEPVTDPHAAGSPYPFQFRSPTTGRRSR